MSTFVDILILLTSSQGGIAYYLILLFSIWAIMGLALSRWSRKERRGTMPHLLIASGLMSFGRFILFVFALLDRQGSPYLVALGVPIERFVDALSLVLVCWALVISAHKHIVGQVFIGLALLFFIGFSVIAGVEWNAAWQADRTLSYNLSWQPWVWEIGQLLFAIAILAYLFAVPIPERGILIVGLGILAIGHLLQIVLPLAEQIPHFAGWVRLANLIAFPLLAVTVFRLTLHRFDAQVAEYQVVSQESLSQVTGLMDLVDISRKLASSLEPESVLENAVRSVAQVVSTNLCAIAFVTQKEIQQMEVVIEYNAQQVKSAQTHFLAEDHPAIEYAITRNKPVILEPGENGQTVGIYHLMGSDQKGPLIVHPLEGNSTVTGIILVGRPGQMQPFSAVEIHKCATLAGQISIAIHNARCHREAESRYEQATADFHLLEVEHTRAKADLENRLKQSQKEIALYVQKVYETEASEQRAHQDLLDLREELNRSQRSQGELEQVKSELQQSLKQVGFLTQTIGQMDAERVELEQRAQTAQQEAANSRTQLAQTEGERNSLKKQVQILQKALASHQSLLKQKEAMEQAHEQSANIGEAMFECMPCGAILLDHTGRVTRINLAAIRTLGDRAAQWTDKLAFDLWPDDEWRTVIHSVTDQFSGSLDIQTLPLNQTQPPVEAVIAPLSIGEQHAGAVVILRDLKPVEERLRAKDGFLNALAQELRTPMTSIVGYTDLLLSGAVSELNGLPRKFLQRVQANIERMGGMLNDLIGITTIDSGKLNIELERVDISHTIEEAIHKAQFRLEEKELKPHLSIEQVPSIYADPESLQQVVDNLLANACKSSLAGTYIRIYAKQDTDDAGQTYLHVSVSDTGGGVSPQDHPRVFERFYRADDALVTGLGETGVGLSIVKSLVEAHQGRIWIESEAGVGSTFHFTIPFGLERQEPQANPTEGNGHG